jgi:hypothetical protein
MQPPNPESPKQQLRIELPATLTVTYANAALISQMLTETVIDFLQVMPNDPRVRIGARIVMTPANAKALLRALAENIARYEERHGEITLPPTLADQLFRQARGLDPEGE